MSPAALSGHPRTGCDHGAGVRHPPGRHVIPALRLFGGGGGGGADWRPGVGGSLAPLCRGSAGSRESGGVVGGGPGCGRAGAPAGRATWLGARGGAPCRSAGAGTQGWAVLDRWLVVVWATIRLRLGLSTFICLLPWSIMYSENNAHYWEQSSHQPDWLELME